MVDVSPASRLSRTHMLFTLYPKSFTVEVSMVCNAGEPEVQISRHSLCPPLRELLGADWQSIGVLNQGHLSDAKAAECCLHLGSGPS